MKISFTLFLFLAVTGFCVGQTPGQIYTFRVESKVKGVKVFPEDTVIWEKERTPLTVRPLGDTEVMRVMLSNGEVEGRDSSYTAFVTEGESTVLSVFIKGSDGKEKLALTREYTIKRIPPPVVMVCGVGKDSVIDKKQLIHQNTILAFSDYHKANCPVLSFDMIVVENGVADTLHSPDKHFTIDMRNRIHKIRPGSVLRFDQIECLLPNNNKAILAPVNIFVDETNKFRIGGQR